MQVIFISVGRDGGTDGNIMHAIKIIFLINGVGIKARVYNGEGGRVSYFTMVLCCNPLQGARPL